MTTEIEIKCKDATFVSVFDDGFCPKSFGGLKVGISNTYATINVKREKKYLHRLIIGAKDGDIVDHINGNRLDNRRDNLRIVDSSQHVMNRTRSRRKKFTHGGPRGIHFIMNNGKQPYWHGVIKAPSIGRLMFCNTCPAIVWLWRLKQEAEVFGEYAPRRL